MATLVQFRSFEDGENRNIASHVVAPLFDGQQVRRNQHNRPVLEKLNHLHLPGRKAAEGRRHGSQD